MRILEEVDQLDHFLLGFVATRHIGERDAVVVLVDQPRPRLAEREGAAFPAALHLSHHVEPEHDDQQGRAEVVKRRKKHTLLFLRLAGHLNAVLHQVADHPDVARRNDGVLAALVGRHQQVAALHFDALDLAAFRIVHELRVRHTFLGARLVELLEDGEQHQGNHQPDGRLLKPVVIQGETPLEMP